MARDDTAEGRRQAYLAALGIPLWASRLPLPGALPGEPLDAVAWQADEAIELPAAEPPAVVPPALGAAPPRTPLVLPSPPAAGAPPSAARAAPASGALPRPAAPSDALPRLQCRVQALAPGWSAVIALGDVPDLAAREYRLLGQIAHALGGESAETPPGELLRWPLNRNPALDHGARAMVEWLAHALRLPQPRCVVFGEELAAYVQAALPARAVVVAPRLAELLDDPPRKRALWQALHA